MMSDETEDALTSEERLQGLLYQYLSLYERWSEDRQVAAKRGADHAELLRQFSAQVAQFKTLAPEVRNDLKKNLSQELTQAMARINDPLKAEASKTMGSFVKDLGQSVFEAQEALRYCQATYTREVAWRQWKILGAVLIGCVAISGLAIHLSVPPVLTTRQLDLLHKGELAEKVFWQMNAQERAHWLARAKEVTSGTMLSAPG